MQIRVITWNLGGHPWSGRAGEQLAALVRRAGSAHAMAAIQEVTPRHHDLFRERFGPDEYGGSLDLRAPRRFEGKNRELGCGLIALGGVRLGEFALVPDVPLPERSLVATASVGGASVGVGSFHSLTGAGYRKAKAIMFQALARFLVDRDGPFVFGMDRNAPKVDRASLEDSEWWWPGQNEEPLMFGHEAAHPCDDVLRTYLSARPSELEALRTSRPDGPLAVTFERGRGTPCRYDAIHASPHWAVEDVRHRFVRGAEALSDHGSVEADLILR